MEVECLALKDLTSPRRSLGVGPKEVKEEQDGCQSEQKENVCLERRRSTPLKSSDATSALLLNRKGATPDLTHITPIKHSSLAEPWTPTANLKMLISAASPDIRDREMKKVLFRPIENEKEKPKSPELVVEEDAEAEDCSQFEAMEEDEMEKKPSRKQKSLGLLCQKFLALYPDYPPLNSPIWISLDKVATSLGVERRRIYDIVNVLESLMIVGRMAKNSYTWYGRRRLEAMLKELQSRGREQGYHLQMELGTEAKDCGTNRDEDSEGDGSNAGSNRKDKSLRIMSQKFVMLFLVSKTQTVTLDAAAKILIEDSQDSSSHSKYKTKVRRLYDIANVLTSLSLIKKVHVREERGRKPAFKWLGPTEFNNTVTSPITALEATQRLTQQDLSRLKMSRHSSFNITPTSAAVQRQVYSAPNSPHREHAALQNQPVDYSRKTTVCRLQFGNTSESHPAAAPHTPASRPQPPLLMPALQPNPIFTSPSSSSSQSHCLAYLPSLSQPSVVMLYRAPDPKEQGPECQRSPGTREAEETRKRKREGEEPDSVVAKKGMNGLEKCNEIKSESQKETRECSEANQSPVSESQPSHYLYVPNNAGLNSLNFILSSGQSPSGLSLPSSPVPTLAVPYVLLPSSSLSHYPLMTTPVQQQQGSESQTKMSVGLPAVVSPAHFMVGTGAYGLGTEVNLTAPTPSTPEQTQLYGAVASTTCSQSVTAQEPLTPHTPKENTGSAPSKSFFQTPATPASAVSAAPNARKRGSAQRRLDVGHPPNH